MIDVIEEGVVEEEGHLGRDIEEWDVKERGCGLWKMETSRRQAMEKGDDE